MMRSVAFARASLALLSAVTIASSPSLAKEALSLTVTPRRAIMDAPFEVTFKGADPGDEVTIRVTRRAEDGTPWSTVGVYRADPTGAVNASTATSVNGSYLGISPHGLLCSALPVEPGEVGTYIARFSAEPRQSRSFDDSIGTTPIEVTASIDGRVVASTTAWRSYAVGTEGEEVSVADGWKGVYFPPARDVEIKAPVLILTGSGGGVFRYTAARLASRGHPTLAFAMYNYSGLPDTLKNFPVENVRDGAEWLAARAGTQRVVVMGVSRGSEAAAHAAIQFPHFFSGVILLVPSHLRDAGALGPAARAGDAAWTVGGKTMPVTDLGFTPDDPRVLAQARSIPGYNATGMVLNEWGSGDFEARYGTPFEKIEAPTLVLAAAEDAIWPSWISAERIRQRFARAGRADQVEVHVYPGAGHSMLQLAFGGPLSTFAYNPYLKGFMAFGGTPNGNCEAAFDSTRDMLAFLERISP